jgi:ribonuclease P protein component
MRLKCADGRHILSISSRSFFRDTRELKPKLNTASVFVKYAKIKDYVSLEQYTNHSHYALIVSKKVGNAVVRSKVKRMLRLCLQKQWYSSMRKGYGYVFIARKYINDYDNYQQLLDKQKVFKK